MPPKQNGKALCLPVFAVWVVPVQTAEYQDGTGAASVFSPSPLNSGEKGWDEGGLNSQRIYEARQYRLLSAEMTTTPVSTLGGSGEIPAACQSETDLIRPLRTA